MGAAPRGLHPVEHLAYVDRTVRNVVLALDPLIDRKEEIAALDLHPVSGKVEEADAAMADAIAECSNGLGHLLPRSILQPRDHKSRLLQRLGHVACIVERV